MKYANYFFGFILLVLAVVLVASFVKDFAYKSVIQIVNISILLFYGIYYLFFKRKKEVSLEGNKLIITKGSKKIKELDLTKKQRVVKGIKTLKIIYQDFSETFNYSQFTKDSIQKLKTLA